MSETSGVENVNHDHKVLPVKNRILKLSNEVYVYMTIMTKESRQT